METLYKDWILCYFLVRHNGFLFGMLLLFIEKYGVLTIWKFTIILKKIWGFLGDLNK